MKRSEMAKIKSIVNNYKEIVRSKSVVSNTIPSKDVEKMFNEFEKEISKHINLEN